MYQLYESLLVSDILIKLFVRWGYRLLMVNILDPVQDQEKIRTNRTTSLIWIKIFDNLKVFLNDFFEEKIFRENSADNKKRA